MKTYHEKQAKKQFRLIIDRGKFNGTIEAFATL